MSLIACCAGYTEVRGVSDDVLRLRNSSRPFTVKMWLMTSLSRH